MRVHSAVLSDEISPRKSLTASEELLSHINTFVHYFLAVMYLSLNEIVLHFICKLKPDLKL